MKIDSRILHTKRIIRKEFISLLNELPLNKITVMKLCDKAQINRATFYRYYEDIYDLYEKLKEEFISDFLESFHRENNLKTEDNIKEFLNEIKKNANIIYALALQNDAIRFAEKLCTKIYFGVENKFNSLFSEFNEKQCHYAYIYTVSGCTGVLGAWLSNGMKTETDEIALLLNKLISNTLQKNQS